MLVMSAIFRIVEKRLSKAYNLVERRATHLETVYLQTLKGMQRSELDTKWGTFSVENGILKGKGLDLGVEPPRIKFC